MVLGVVGTAGHASVLAAWPCMVVGFVYCSYLRMVVTCAGVWAPVVQECGHR
jgi:hypothetical protein